LRGMVAPAGPAALEHQGRRRDLPALVERTHEVLLRHDDILEKHLVEVPVAIQEDQRAHRDARGFHVDEQVGDAVVLGRGRIGARARKYSSSQITCCMKLAPSPPYSLGQEIPTQPASCIFFCQAMRFSRIARSGEMRWSCASSTLSSSLRLASSQSRNSRPKAACPGA